MYNKRIQELFLYINISKAYSQYNNSSYSNSSKKALCNHASDCKASTYSSV